MLIDEMEIAIEDKWDVNYEVVRLLICVGKIKAAEKLMYEYWQENIKKFDYKIVSHSLNLNPDLHCIATLALSNYPIELLLFIVLLF